MHKHTALIAAGMVAGSIVAVAPAPATSPTDRLTTFLFDARSAKGLVALTQGTSGAELSFHLYGLAARTKYKLVVSSRGCTSAKGTITSRTFRTDARGFYWDPIAVQSNAVPATARIVRASTGKVVSCNTQPRSGLPPVSVSKLTNASPGVLTVSQGPASWQIAMSIAGLKSQKTYQLFALDGGCSESSPLVAAEFFRSARNGAALLDFNPPREAGKVIRSVAVIERANLEVVFCKVL